MEIARKSKLPIRIIEYLKEPLSLDSLVTLVTDMEIEPIELVRTKDKLFKELGYTKKDKKEPSEWLKILVQNPRLMERPIVRYNNQTIIARPPEKILDILPG